VQLYNQYVLGVDGIGQYDRIKQMRKFVKEAKFLIENVRIALESSMVESQVNVSYWHLYSLAKH
jgi:hypothetical protein